MGSFQKLYQDKIAKQLKKQFSYSTIMQVPKVVKITLNMGVGEAAGDKKVLDSAMADMKTISGQQPIKTETKKAIAGFKIREGWPIGCKVTLRKYRMYDFLERLICIAIPRIRDFRGFSVKSFDKQGNYSLGIKEQIVFPEIDYDKIDMVRGLDITITTTAKTDEEGLALLKAFNFPFKNT